jgi:hypothetical protein
VLDLVKATIAIADAVSVVGRPRGIKGENGTPATVVFFFATTTLKASVGAMADFDDFDPSRVGQIVIGRGRRCLGKTKRGRIKLK